MSFDMYSTRAYMSDCLKYSRTSINWMETMTYSTGFYDQALSETVFEDMAFGGDPTTINWYTLNGGSQVLSDAMEASLPAGSIKKGRCVRAIEAVTKDGKPESKVTGVKVSFTTRDKDGKLVVDEDGNLVVTQRKYEHVISTVPLTTLRTLDIDNARLNFRQKTALRILQYGPAIKVGVKFKTAWWTDKSKIVGGQSFTDRSIRTVVYPSYPTTVLIASYCWTHDAIRLGALINSGEDAATRLKDLVLRDLAAVHGLEVDFLKDQYVEHFAFDWTHDPLTQGAYAFFGPGEFSTVYDSLTSFAADGRLHFAGEALSIRHAWVVGALDSAWRAVKEILCLSFRTKGEVEKFQLKWGVNPEWISSPPEQKPGPPPGQGPIPFPLPGDASKEDLLFKHIWHQNPEFLRNAARTGN